MTATASVDPRFRARRIAVRKEAGRRRLVRLLVLIAVAIAALATVIVLRSPILDVDEVQVHGARTIDAGVVRELAGIDVGSPILLADLGAAEARLEQLSWVADAQVSRALPGQVSVAVTERVPVAVLDVAGQALLVDADGVVVDRAPASATTAYVHVVTGGDAPAPGESVDPRVAPAVEVAGQLRSDPVGVVSSVVLEPSLRLQVRTGGIVDFGDATRLEDKIAAFRTVHARVDQTCLGVLDLRVPTHPVLTRAEDC